MFAIPLIWLCADAFILSIDEVIELEDTAAVLSAVESDFEEQATNASKLIIADIFGTRRNLVMVGFSARVVAPALFRRHKICLGQPQSCKLEISPDAIPVGGNGCFTRLSLCALPGANEPTNTHRAPTRIQEPVNESSSVGSISHSYQAISEVALLRFNSDGRVRPKLE